MEELRKKLESIVNKKISSDDEDFSVCDYSGGNYDDAYELGCESGEKWLAQEILAKFFGQDGHASDCAVHNEPASPNLPCDCSEAK